jgi:hypothetical protein
MGRQFSNAAIACLTFASILQGSRAAHGQSAGKNPVAAQALYDEARRLVGAGNYQEACPKFKESYQLDPGGGTLLNLADCYEKQGRLALAWTTFKEALVVAQRDRRDDRMEFATQHVGALENRLAYVTVNVGEKAHAQGLSVSIDGAALGEAAWGVAMPVDPGKHTVRADAPGKRAFVTTVDVAPAKAVRQRIDIPELADESGGPPSDAKTARVAVGTATAAPEEKTNSKRTVGWVVGGAGVASIGVATYFGLRAFSRWGDRNDACPGGVCSSAAKSAGDDANQAATISTVAFGAGLVAVGVGTYLILSGGGDKERPSPTVGSLRIEPGALRRGAGLWVTGQW